jgi:hypothetical protein
MVTEYIEVVLELDEDVVQGDVSVVVFHIVDHIVDHIVEISLILMQC